jgi:hypothetical protein
MVCCGVPRQIPLRRVIYASFRSLPNHSGSLGWLQFVILTQYEGSPFDVRASMGILKLAIIDAAFQHGDSDFHIIVGHL